MLLSDSLRTENLRLTKTGHKRCGRCLEVLSLDHFWRRKRAKPPHRVGEVLSHCKECTRKTRRESYAPEGHWYHKYGLTPERARELKEAQGNVCAICKEPPERWFVDHCHKTGRVRALVCRYCNTMLGFAKERPEVLEVAANYLRAHGDSPKVAPE